MIDSAVSQQIIQNYFMKKQQLEEGNVKESGMQFLEENKNKEGIQVTETGLQYTVIFEGDGKQPSETSNVTVHYHGTTPEGEVFDSSVERGEPATFGLNQVIKGWTEGVQLMKEGAKYKFFIPQELAYGANPRPGGPIKPYMPLVFEIELISVND
jgi:FKBP-type peptidyl-prolyl cis-trans isomerase